MGEGGNERGGAADDKAAPLLALQAQYHVAMHNLWAVYVAATFAAAGFGASAEPRVAVALAVTTGFWMFTRGHRELLRQTLSMIEAIRLDLKDVKLPDSRLTRALEAGVGNSNSWKTAARIHLGIDLCVTAAIWFPFLRFQFL